MIMRKLEIENIIHSFRLDELEVFWTFKYEGSFDKYKCDREVFYDFENYKVVKIEIPKYKYNISFRKWIYTLFSYCKWKDKSKSQPIATKDYITIYWKAFKLLEYEEILWFLESNFGLKHCRRFDICCDLKINIDELLNNYFEDYITGGDRRYSWKTGSRYFWEKAKSKNKRQIIRVYDKIKQINEESLIDLYQDYLTFPNITRVELEIRQELAKVINYKDVFNNELLIRIFKNYLNKYTKIFENIGWEKITLYRAKNLKLNSEDYQSLFYKTWRLSNFIWSARTIYNLWFCPVRVLIWEWYIQDKTRRVLWVENIVDMINKERELKVIARENYYIRNNISEILSNVYKYGKV